MALFGSLETLRSQLATTPAFQRAFAYAEECLTEGSPAFKRLHAVGIGQTERVELGDGVFALDQAYDTKPSAMGRWESHRAYVDVQVIVAGDELMEVADVKRLVVAEDFTPARDVLFYQPFGEGSVLRMKAGEAAVFFPVDGHKPSLAVGSPSLVRKTVVKVPVVA